jgi:ribosomal protein S12 methylthiotransferase
MSVRRGKTRGAGTSSRAKPPKLLRSPQDARFGRGGLIRARPSLVTALHGSPSTLKVSIVTLGCDKNTVDSERYLAQLVDHGAEPTGDVESADVILVNTCGFIDAAKKESIDAIIEAARLKEDHACRAVVAVGCMVQRHKAELEAELPEVDLFLGTTEVDRLVPELAARGLIGDVPQPHPGVRVFSGGDPLVRYLKISEGCDHGCAFCAIPLMRGRHRSFAIPDVVAEAQLLEAQGAREVNLVAQDLAHWGRDLRQDRRGLPDLLSALLEGTGIPWFRLLYIYSAGITDRLLELIAGERRIVPYLDMPIQHGSDEVLARMRRPERRRTILEKVARVRRAVPSVAIRTTCIVGFPGETEDDFDRLLDLLDEARFERVGAFTYSPQEGTRAADLADDVPEPVKQDRLERLLELQRRITAERYATFIGSTAEALVLSVDEANGSALGRTAWQADDIDGTTSIIGPGIRRGDIVELLVQGVVDDFDMSGQVVGTVAAAGSAVRLPDVRALPVIGNAGIGSFGR